jgi:hypothetical protein
MPWTPRSPTAARFVGIRIAQAVLSLCGGVLLIVGVFSFLLLLFQPPSLWFHQSLFGLACVLTSGPFLAAHELLQIAIEVISNQQRQNELLGDIEAELRRHHLSLEARMRNTPKLRTASGSGAATPRG